ncbi:hypothetical protein HMPREF1375_01668 [Enterococcus faecium P1986]|nr:hypothetical protein HMPREF1375_01668 [Enterococcus faecium P1986]
MLESYGNFDSRRPLVLCNSFLQKKGGADIFLDLFNKYIFASSGSVAKF